MRYPLWYTICIAYRITLTPQAQADVAGLRANRRPVVLRAIITDLHTSPPCPRGIESACGPTRRLRGSCGWTRSGCSTTVDEVGLQVTVERVYTKREPPAGQRGREVTLDEPEA